MPSNKKGYMGAYYRAHKAKFNSAKERAKRAKRNKARRIMVKAGKARKGDGKDVDHKKPLSRGGSNKRSNLRMMARSKNRGKYQFS